LQGFVGVVEGKDLGLRFDAEPGCAFEIVASVLAGHVGYAADLAFAPEEGVVVEGGHLVEVDGVDGDDASFAKAGKSADDDGSAGGEGDGAVKLNRRLVVFGADPLCAELGGLVAMVLAAGRDVDLAVPVAEDLDGLRGGGTEAEEADAVARLCVGDAEAAEADDSGAEERCYVGVVEGVGERVHEVGADEGVFGVAAVDGVAGEGGVVAEILFVVSAEAAGAVGAADPGDADASVWGEFGGGAFDDFADDLVAEGEGLVDEGKVAFEDVEVGAADSAGEDAEEDVVRGEGWAGDFFDLEGLIGGVEDGGFHLSGSLAKGLTRIVTDDTD